MNIWTELRRRNVFRVGAAYAVVAWLILQVGDLSADNLGFPDWFMPMLFVLLGLGFPLALFLAWAFELTPEGLKREKDVPPAESIRPKTARRLDRLIIGVLALVVAVLLAERFWPDGDPATDAEIDRSIAVLPFDDFSPDGDDAWFANGLAEEILNALAQTPDLRVASRTSSFRQRDSSQDVTDIGNALGVAHVLEGSVRRSPKRIRVTAQLIRTDDGFHIWSETYDRTPSEVISIQEDIATDIASALKTAMDPDALREMVRVGTTSVEAYTAYLRGLELRRESLASGQFSLQAAIGELERARSLDPDFAEVLYQLADLYRSVAAASVMYFSEDVSADESWQRAQAMIRNAVSSAGESVARMKYEAHGASMRLEFGRARERLATYLEERPNDLDAWIEFRTLGQKLNDKEIIRQASDELLRIAPQDPFVVWDVGAQLLLSGYVAEGADLLERALSLDPDSRQIQYQAHRGFLWAGRTADAQRLESALLTGGMNPRFKIPVRLRAACSEGDRESAELAAAEAPDIWDRWYAQKILGNQAAATRILAPLDQTPAGRNDLSGFLAYPFFDPTPFPNLSAVLAREGVERPAPVDIPFACPPEETPSVAVLPFVNMSSNTEQEYFSDGMTEEIINTLVRRTDLSVAARTSVFAFKGEKRNVSEIGRSLDVSHVIEGSVRSAGEQVRITAQLITVKDGFHLWSETYDRELTNIFAVQEEIASSVAEALSQALSGTGSDTARATTDPTTYDLYLQARALLRKRGDEPLAQAAELLAAAVQRDPAFAPAWATAAQVADVSEHHDEAIEWAERALALDPHNVDALNALGAAYRDSFRWAEAEDMLQRALEIDPESSELLEDYAEFLGATGRTDEMLEIARRGWLIDPYLPPLAAVYAEALLIAGDREEALRVIDALDRLPEMPPWVQVFRFSALRDVVEDERLVESIESIADSDMPLWQSILAAVRNPGDENATAALVEAVNDIDAPRQSADEMASTYALLHLGRPEPVLAYQIRHARKWIPPDLEWIWAPLFDDLRALPRFGELLEVARLPEYWDANGWPDACARMPDGGIECR